MLPGLIVIIIGFICTYIHIRSSRDNSESKATPKKTFVIAMFMVLATLSLSIGASILQNKISLFNLQLKNPDVQTSNQEDDLIQQENKTNSLPNTDSDDAASGLPENSDLQNNSLNTGNSLQNQLIAKEKNGKWGYVNQAGEIIIPFQYDFANDFSEGLAAVRKMYDWGFIDETGNTIIPFMYDGAWDFIDGLAPVFKDELWGFIDKNNDLVIPFQYMDISFSNSTYYDENKNPIEY